MADFTQVIHKLKEDVQKAMGEQTAGGYERVDAIVQELDVLMRESIQESTSAEMKRIIRDLRAGKDVGVQFPTVR